MIVPLSDHPYYLWQALVQAVEFKRLGIPATYLVYTQTSAPPARLRAIMGAGWSTGTSGGTGAHPRHLQRGDETVARREGLTANLDRVDAPFVLIDPDWYPHPSPRWRGHGTRWFGTDTDSYTGPGYLRSKPGVWDALCALVGVDPTTADRPGVGRRSQRSASPGSSRTVAAKSIEAHAMMTAGPTDVQAWCRNVRDRPGVRPSRHRPRA